MPIIKSAKKKLKQDKKRSLKNRRTTQAYKSAIKIALSKPSKKTVSIAYSAIDKSAKVKLIHKNKADRLKKQVAHAQN